MRLMFWRRPLRWVIQHECGGYKVDGGWTPRRRNAKRYDTHQAAVDDWTYDTRIVRVRG